MGRRDRDGILCTLPSEPAPRLLGGLRRKWCSLRAADPSWVEQTATVPGSGGGRRGRIVLKGRGRCFPPCLQHFLCTWAAHSRGYLGAR